MNIRDHKLDTLKALAIVLVIIWHLQPIRIYPVDSFVIPLSKKVLDIVYQRTLVAVPIFYFVSFLLLFKKNSVSNGYLIKRLKRIATVFLFWSFIQTAIYLILKKGSFFFRIRLEFPAIDSSSWFWLVMGGPPLPAVGESVFYFLFNLLVMTFLAFFYSQIASKSLDLSLFIIFTIYIFAHKFFFVISFWRIDNFLIYIPISHFIAKNYYHKMISLRSLIFSLCLYVMFSIGEILFYKNLNITYGSYGKNSLQWGVISLYVFIQLVSFKKYKIIEWLSKYSLGLFALHKYWLLFFIIIAHETAITLGIPNGDTFLKYLYISVFTPAIVFTCLTVIIMNKNRFLKKFVA